eukprot:TRINITY_DN24738_c0_g1_i1.p1 TRINITY_DN24738_c0_g1~~TRINITY_DN24738_c0_g1_i1.p1  ORF type:complete len:272 (-),score=56.15 TRINITY_DN24738_c0_g1_i1:280-1095(-)
MSQADFILYFTSGSQHDPELAAHLTDSALNAPESSVLCMLAQLLMQVVYTGGGEGKAAVLGMARRLIQASKLVRGETLEELNLLANACVVGKEYAEALALYRRAFEIDGATEFQRGVLLMNMAVPLIKLGRVEEGLALNLQAETILNKIFGGRHVKLAVLYAGMSEAEQLLGRTDAAMEYARRAREVFLATAGAYDTRCLSTTQRLCTLLTEKGLFDEAHELMAQVLVRLRTLHGEPHPRYQKAAKLFDRVCQGMSYAEANQWMNDTLETN